MRIPWLYTGPDNRSHFAVLDVPWHAIPTGQSTPDLETTTLAMRESKGGMLELHTAPRRQLVIVLTGAMEIECGDGSKQQFAAGQLFLADDTSGEGHITRDVLGPRVTAQAGLPPALDLEPWRVTG